jgi:Zn finger protein HypA/HybF involved in hydrogenase expression
MYKNNIVKVANEILDWAGPSGLCWCEDRQKFIDPNDARFDCPECEPIDRIDDPPSRFLRRNDNFEVGITSKKKKTISEVSEEILEGFRDWYGPIGDCWCNEKRKFVTPGEAGSECPECENLNAQDIREFRYLHLHDDFKSF